MRTPPFVQGDVKQTPNSVLNWFRTTRNDEVDFLVKDVSGNQTVSLSSNDTHSHIIRFTGALTGNINVIVSSLTISYIIHNSTSGAFTLTIKTASGTGIAVGQGKVAILFCDGTNVLRATADV